MKKLIFAIVLMIGSLIVNFYSWQINEETKVILRGVTAKQTIDRFEQGMTIKPGESVRVELPMLDNRHAQSALDTYQKMIDSIAPGLEICRAGRYKGVWADTTMWNIRISKRDTIL